MNSRIPEVRRIKRGKQRFYLEFTRDFIKHFDKLKNQTITTIIKCIWKLTHSFLVSNTGKFSLDLKICDPILLTWNLQIKSTIFSERLVSLIG